jgi:hypothetical protein
VYGQWLEGSVGGKHSGTAGSLIAIQKIHPDENNGERREQIEL